MIVLENTNIHINLEREIILVNDSLVKHHQLHWLPIESRIQFKLCLIMHLIHTGRCPSYISDTVQLVADHATRTGLCSASNSWHILSRLRTIFVERTFSFSGPKTWNSLLDRFHSPESTVSLKKNSSKHFYSITLFIH